MIRLKDIADRAGVSIMTVSRVLRDAPDISAATRARVRQLAKEMGYVPDALAQSLRNRTTRLCGLVVSAATHPTFARTLMAIEEEIRSMGYDLILAQSLNQPEREEQVIRKLLARHVDGLFISPVYRLQPRAAIYEELARHGTPTVILGQKASFCESFANVEVEDAAASQQVTRHLLELGHRRIAFLAGPQSEPSCRDRLEGYRRALREANVAWDDSLIFSTGTTIQAGEAAALQMFSERTQATAVQAVNDLVAIGAATAFLQQGFLIPQHLSIAGFGNVLASEFFRVPLTTVRQPKRRLGVAAADLMKQLLRGLPPRTQRLSADLLVRASTGPRDNPEAEIRRPRTED